MLPLLKNMCALISEIASVCMWIDNKVVTTLWTLPDVVTEATTCLRWVTGKNDDKWEQREFQQPVAITYYNRYMNG